VEKPDLSSGEDDAYFVVYKVWLFLGISKFCYSTVYDKPKVDSLLKTSSIYIAVSIQYLCMMNGRTDGHRDIEYTVLKLVLLLLMPTLVVKLYCDYGNIPTSLLAYLVSFVLRLVLWWTY